MHSESGEAREVEQIPRIAPGRDASALSMSPAEGFLWSRIDGNTPWRLLRDIGGIPADQVDQTLARWVEEGLLVLDSGNRGLSSSGTAATPPPEEEKEVEIDTSVDLSPELQREILEFESSLASRSYFEILGVDRDADGRTIKKAYFALSKKFHPDRYFRRDTGRFSARLDGIFKSVMEAYELLSDPTTRAEIEKGIAWAPPPPEPEPEPKSKPQPKVEPEPTGTGYRVPSRMENLERLRARFRPPAKLVAERRMKAHQFFEAATLSMSQHRWLEAAASARLAIAFDPWNPEYKTGFVEIQAHVNRERAVQLLEEAQDAGSQSDPAAQSEAMRLLEEAIHYRPLDPIANARAASLGLEMGDLARAREYSEAVVEIEPEVAANYVLLARVLRRQGEAKAAKRAISRASKLAPDDDEVKAERRLQLRDGKG